MDFILCVMPTCERNFVENIKILNLLLRGLGGIAGQGLTGGG